MGRSVSDLPDATVTVTEMDDERLGVFWARGPLLAHVDRWGRAASPRANTINAAGI